jgi:hypothetical protein
MKHAASGSLQQKPRGAKAADVLTRGRAVLFVAAAYFAAIFSFAFAMGVARALVITPLIGPTFAVCIEIPILLVASWFLARHSMSERSFELPDRIAIGVIAFALTMASEAFLAGLIRDQSVIAWAAAVLSPLGLVGLAGQLGFGAMPALAGRNPTTPAVITR